MRYGVPKCLDRLAADECDASFVERAGGDDGQPLACLLKVLFYSEQTGFEIERVDDGFGQQEVDTGLDQGRDLLVVRIDHFIEVDAPPGGVVNAGRDGHLPGSRT